jgi:hypothetical protein
MISLAVFLGIEVAVGMIKKSVIGDRRSERGNSLAAEEAQIFMLR